MMKEDKTENPNAFPTRTKYEDPTHPTYSGMTLRDYFAAKAMNGMIASMANPNAMTSPSYLSYGEMNKICETSYEIADAMLKQRNQ